MRIRSVHIEGFGCLVDRTFEFGDGLTLLLGPNESGKTTLVRAITAILFGQQPDERDANTPWGGGTYAGSLELIENGRMVRIRREFDTEHVEVTEAEGGGSRTWSGIANPRGRGSEIETYRGHLVRLVGLADPELFRSTLCVEQLAVKAEISSEIRSRLTGPKQADAEQVLRGIEGRFADVSNERLRAGKPRELQLVEREIDEKTRLLDATWDYFDEVRRLREQDAELKERLDALASEQANGERVFKAIDALADARQDRDRLAREVPALSAERERISARLADQKKLTDEIGRDYAGWETLPDDYGTMLLEMARRRDDVVRSRDDVERLEREAASAKSSAQRLWLLVPVLVLAAGYALGHFLDDLLLYVAIGGGVAAVLLVALLVGQLARMRRQRRHAHELTAATERYEENQTSLKALGAQLAPFMTGDDPHAEQKRYDRYRPLSARLDSVRSVIESSRDLGAVEGDYHEKNAALDRAETTLRELTQANPSLRRFLDEADPLREREVRRSELERRRSTLEATREERTRVQAELRALTRRQVANEPTLRGEIDELKRRRERLERRRDALGLAIDTLREAITEYHTVHRESLAGAIGALFSRLTGGRYSGVRLDEGFVPSLSGLGRGELAVERVSQGARDQLYFAVRVAVARELSGQVRLPFILDDAFVNFDDERLAAAYAILHELACQHQFIVLTHSARERSFVEHCLELA
jgi:DNA repair exonuclease SbcCD ATPase subunit